MKSFVTFALITAVSVVATLITRNLVAGFMTMTFLGLAHGVRVAAKGQA